MVNEMVVKEVEFNGGKFLGIYDDGKIYTPLKRFCDFLGLDFNGQCQRIKRDEVLKQGMCKVHIPTNGGKQEALVLENSFLPLWLAGIKSNQCREEIREDLINFKLKAKDVLAEAFLGKRTNERVEALTKDWALREIHERTEQIGIIEEEIMTLMEKASQYYKDIEDISKIRKNTTKSLLNLGKEVCLNMK